MEDMSDEQRVECAFRGGSADTTHGFQALNGQMDPLEALMAKEEVNEDKVRSEFMQGLMGYFFADGQVWRPEYVARRVYAVACARCPYLLLDMSKKVLGDIKALCDEWLVVRQAYSLEDLLYEGDHEDRDALRAATLRAVMRYFFSNDKPEDWKLVTKKVYGLAKSFYPHLIDGISLEELGEVFGEDKPKAHRARWSARIKTWVNKPIEEAGGVAHSKFQKSATASQNYSAAQQGNSNRKKK